MSAQKTVKEDPESAKLVQGKPADDSIHEDKGSSLCAKCCAACCAGCCRLLIAFVLFPFVIVLTLLAILVWLILLPLRLCSVCLEPVVALVVKILTLPLRIFRWALGGSFKDDVCGCDK